MACYILVIDEGTTSTRAIIFDEKMKEVSSSQKKFNQYFPRPGWVEQDAEEIFKKVLESIKEALQKGEIDSKDILAIGITNQRETVVPFDRDSAKSLHNAIVWQCRRTTQLSEALKEQGMEKVIHEKTGLFLDPYFSGTKIRWLLENVPQVNNKKTLFGTIDAFLVYKLSGGKFFKTDVTNASRTLLFNINNLQYDKELLHLFKVNEEMLPEVVESVDIFGTTSGIDILPDGVPITGVMGDQQAALFGQGGVKKGIAKNTYGTGSFLLLNTGDKPQFFDKGILTTIASKIKDKTQYAIEGSIFIVGALIDWLLEVGLLKSFDELNDILSNGIETDIYFVPAFTGLSAPHWDPYARGGIFGLTRGTKREDIVKGAIYSIALQTEGLLRFIKEKYPEVSEMRVDGGVAKNDYIMQLQSDMSHIKIIRPVCKESTAKGAALLAAIGAGILQEEEIGNCFAVEKVFNPLWNNIKREAAYEKYLKAVERVKNWEK
ncbi:MAG: glycerol kinase GlpK [Caldisericaceae bacterium]|nr:glycerol kinase GlpK [Caldisericaceae bacterium]